MDIPYLDNPHRLGPRVPTAEPEPFGRMVNSVLDFAMPNRVIAARAETTTSSSSTPGTTCAADNTTGVCERGTGSSTYTLPIVLGVW